MNDEKLYRVLIELDVTAKDEDEAIASAVRTSSSCRRRETWMPWSLT